MITLARLLFLLYLSSAAFAAPPTALEIERHVVGTWFTTISTDDGGHVDMVGSYYANRRATILIRERNSGSAISGELSYRVTRRGIETTTLSSTDAKALPVGAIDTDLVTKIDRYDMQVKQDGSYFTLMKIDRNPGNTACDSGAKSIACIRAVAAAARPAERAKRGLVAANSWISSADGSLALKVASAHWMRVKSAAPSNRIVLAILPVNHLSVMPFDETMFAKAVASFDTVGAATELIGSEEFAIESPSGTWQIQTRRYRLKKDQRQVETTGFIGRLNSTFIVQGVVSHLPETGNDWQEIVAFLRSAKTR